MMQIEYLEELPQALQADAAALFITALADKLTPVLGGGERAKRTLLAGMNRRRCLVAIDGGELVGILAVQTSRGGFIEPTFVQLREIYGWWGAVWRIGGLSSLGYGLDEREWHIEGLAVSELARGRGVGTRLLSWVEELAKASKVERLTLQVIDINPRAKKLYQRIGFGVTGEKMTWPLSWFYGFPFRQVISMEKALSVS